MDSRQLCVAFGNLEDSAHSRDLYLKQDENDNGIDIDNLGKPIYISSITDLVCPSNMLEYTVIE